MATSEARRSQPGAVIVDRPVTHRAAVYTLGLAAIFLTCAGVFISSMMQSNPLGSDRTWGSGLFTIVFLILVVAQALNFTRLSSERYVVNNETIEITSGILRRDARKIPISNVLDVTSNVSFDRRLFGLGNITISIANGDTITLEDITDSQNKAETLWKLVHKARGIIMQKKQVWLITILMLASAIIGGVTSNALLFITEVEAQRNTNAAKPAARRYEYLTYIAPGPKELADQANKLADDGWELADVVTDERVVTRYVGFFKRPKQ